MTEKKPKAKAIIIGDYNLTLSNHQNFDEISRKNEKIVRFFRYSPSLRQQGGGTVRQHGGWSDKMINKLGKNYEL